MQRVTVRMMMSLLWVFWKQTDMDILINNTWTVFHCRSSSGWPAAPTHSPPPLWSTHSSCTSACWQPGCSWTPGRQWEPGCPLLPPTGGRPPAGHEAWTGGPTWSLNAFLLPKVTASPTGNESEWWNGYLRYWHNRQNTIHSMIPGKLGVWRWSG